MDGIFFLQSAFLFKISLMFGNSFQGSVRSSSMPRNASNYFKPSYTVAQQPMRQPLYPIGPTIPQQQFKPTVRGLSPYVSKQGLYPPSYEQRYLPQSVMANRLNGTGMSANRTLQMNRGDFANRERSMIERQRSLIARNEAEIQEEQRKREQTRASYERQIDVKSKNLLRNVERKQKLLTEMETLSKIREQTHDKLMSLRIPHQEGNMYEPLDRKQQQIIIAKGKMVAEMREKEKELHQAQEQEVKHWEQQIAQKERVLFQLEETGKQKRMELHNEKHSLEKPDYYSIEQEVRQTKYDEFIYQAAELESKIQRMADQREQLLRDLFETTNLKKPIIHSQRNRHEQLSREAVIARMKISDLGRITTEMSSANENLQNDLHRKQSMVERFEVDISELKKRITLHDSTVSKLFENARNEQEKDTFMPSIQNEIKKTQDELRAQIAVGSRLRGSYQKLYELLSSSLSMNIHQTFKASVVA